MPTQDLCSTLGKSITTQGSFVAAQRCHFSSHLTSTALGPVNQRPHCVKYGAASQLSVSFSLNVLFRWHSGWHQGSPDHWLMLCVLRAAFYHKNLCYQWAKTISNSCKQFVHQQDTVRKTPPGLQEKQNIHWHRQGMLWKKETGTKKQSSAMWIF